MQFIRGIIVIIVFTAAMLAVGSLISSVIGYDGMIVYIVAFIVILVSLYYVGKKIKVSKEKNLIMTWYRAGYTSAIAVFNGVLPEAYKIRKSEEKAFEEIFRKSMDEAKKDHFDNNAKNSNEELMKNEDAWLAATMGRYCIYDCSWEKVYEGRIKMLEYKGEISKMDERANKVRYYDVYGFTDSGRVAEKILMGYELLWGGYPGEYKFNLDNGWVRKEKDHSDEK